MSLVPLRYDFALFQGATFDETLVIKDADGVAVNLTGKKFRAQVRREVSDTGSPLISCSTASGHFTLPGGGTDGRVRWVISAAVTAALPVNYEKQQWAYDVEMFDDAVSPEYVERLLEGRIRAYPEVTRA